jgi:hypothetical protein
LGHLSQTSLKPGQNKNGTDISNLSKSKPTITVSGWSEGTQRRIEDRWEGDKIKNNNLFNLASCCIPSLKHA